MRRTIGLWVIAFAALQFGFTLSTSAQSGQDLLQGAQGKVMIPNSSNPSPLAAGIRAHTNMRIFVPDAARPTPDELPPFAGYGYETPASLACIYGLVTPWTGCNPNNPSATNPSGGSNAIAVVVAYHDPTAAADLAYFSAQFNLPAPNFSVVYAGGSAPPVDPTGGWELEASLDIEYSHAMAPNAQIYLVEANSNLDTDLFNAVDVASNLVICGGPTCHHGGNGKGEVSMGWGGDEFKQESSLDRHFNNSGVVYLAAAGDAPGVEYPCVSPNVVCIGGTSTARNPYSGNFLYEVAWAEGGGGSSAYESRPSYQSVIGGTVGPTRGVPDIAFDGNPNTGVWVFDSNEVDSLPGGWFIVGGTSVGAPSMAGIVNAAGHFYASSGAELNTIYSNRSNHSDYTDVMKGYCGPYVGFATTPGWDFCTGVGSIVGYSGK